MSRFGDRAERVGPLGGWWWFLLPMVASAATRELWAPDEPRYAEVARTIYQGGDFLVMHLSGAIYPDKPPLLFWLAGFFGWLSGWSEFAMRLPSLAATLGSAWLISRMARRWWGELEGAWAAAMYLSFFLVTELGGRLQIDPLLAFWTLAALELWTRPEASARRRIWSLVGAGLCLGLGALAKGPVSYLHLILAVLPWSLAGVRESTVRVPRWTWLVVVLCAIAPVVGWAVAASLREPQLFEALFFDQHLGRVANATEHSGHAGPPWKHLIRLVYLLLPWTMLVLLELRRAWSAFRSRAGQVVDHATLRAALWFAAAVLFFSVIPPKRDLYLLPAYPAVALLAARALGRCFEQGRLGRWVGGLGPGLMALAGVLLVGVGINMSEIPGAWWRAPLVGLPLVAGAVLSLRSLRRPRRWANLVVWSWCVSFTVLALLVFPPVNPLKSGRLLALELAALPQNPQSIPCIRVHSEAYRFYAGVPTVDASGLEPYRERDGEDFVGLVLEKYWLAMSPEEQQRYRVIHRRRVGGKHIVVLGAAHLESAPEAP